MTHVDRNLKEKNIKSKLIMLIVMINSGNAPSPETCYIPDQVPKITNWSVQDT